MSILLPSLSSFLQPSVLFSLSFRSHLLPALVTFSHPLWNVLCITSLITEESEIFVSWICCSKAFQENPFVSLAHAHTHTYTQIYHELNSGLFFPMNGMAPNRHSWKEHFFLKSWWNYDFKSWKGKTSLCVSTCNGDCKDNLKRKLLRESTVRDIKCNKSPSFLTGVHLDSVFCRCLWTTQTWETTCTPQSVGAKMAERNWGQHTVAQSHWAAWFCWACKLRIVLHFINDWKKIKRTISCDTWKWCNIHIPVSMKFAGTQLCPLIDILSHSRCGEELWWRLVSLRSLRFVYLLL